MTQSPSPVTPPAPWIAVCDQLPPLGEVVDTRIDDGRGVRKEAKLKRRGINGRLCFFEDGSMYVYYEPTHWKAVSNGK